MLDDAHCPACRKSHRLTRVQSDDGEIDLYRCERCRGVLVTKQSVSRAASREPALPALHSDHSCRRCGAVARLEALHCPTCAAPLGIECPLCWTTMDVVRAGRVVVDVCHRCEFLFFDEGELAEAFRDPAQLASASGGGAPRSASLAVRYRPVSTAATDAPDSTALVIAALGAAGFGGKVALGVSAATVIAASAMGRAILQLLSTMFR